MMQREIMKAEDFERILQSNPSIEAVIHISSEGFPLAWRSQNDSQVEEITAIAAGLFKAGKDMDLLKQNDEGRLSIHTSHGEMHVKELHDGDMLLILAVSEKSTEGTKTITEKIFSEITA